MEALQRALYSKRIRRRQPGDAPLQKADMAQIRHISGLDAVLQFYEGAIEQFPGINLHFEDFRLHQALTKGSMIIRPTTIF